MSESTFNPPSWLDRTAKEYWRRVAPPLEAEGVLNSMTFDLLAAAAQAYSTYRESQKMLKEQGRVITTKTGSMKSNPWQAVEKQAFEMLARVYKELNVAEQEAPVDAELDAFIERKPC